MSTSLGECGRENECYETRLNKLSYSSVSFSKRERKIPQNANANVVVRAFHLVSFRSRSSRKCTIMVWLLPIYISRLSQHRQHLMIQSQTINRKCNLHSKYLMIQIESSQVQYFPHFRIGDFKKAKQKNKEIQIAVRVQWKRWVNTDTPYIIEWQTITAVAAWK